MQPFDRFDYSIPAPSELHAARVKENATRGLQAILDAMMEGKTSISYQDVFGAWPSDFMAENRKEIVDQMVERILHRGWGLTLSDEDGHFHWENKEAGSSVPKA